MSDSAASTTPRSSEGVMAGWTWFVVALCARLYLVFVAALALCAVLPLLTGLTGSVVQSGSMEPKISAGDVVLVRPVELDDPLPMGRVITFAAPTGSAHPGTMLHRLVGERSDGSLVTAGDANADVDSTPIARRDIIARGALLIPWIGQPALWIGTGQLLPLLLWGGVTLLAIAVETLSAVLERGGRHRGLKGPGTRGRLVLDTRRLVPLVASVMLGVTLVLPWGAGLTPVDAAFTARSTSVGNSWSAAAAAPATRLAFTTSPSASTGGRVFTTQPAVTVRNAAGGTVTGTRTVTLALTTAAGATLSCGTNPLTSTSGIVAFSGCRIDKVGSYTLTATSGTLTPAVSATVVITAGPGAALRFGAQPATTAATSAFAIQPSVAIVDAGGNATTSTASVGLALTTASGATLTCTTNPRAAVSGTATFAGCRIDKPGTYTITASSGSLVSAISSTIVITSAPRPQLVCQSSVWYATFSWSPTPFTPTTYHLYVNGVQVTAQGADGYNSYVQLSPTNVPVGSFPQGTATVEVRKVIAGGLEETIGFGTVVLGSASYRTYLCG
ncbi:MAG: signal peptidase I [Lacisediminihabitans sp.]